MSLEPISAARPEMAAPRPLPLHPAWLTLIRLCRELGLGEIERLVVQDGLPVLAEVTRKKVKLT